MKEILLEHFKSLLGRSNRDTFSENEGKNYMKEDTWKSFFSKLAGWHLATSVQINLFTDNFQGF